MESGAFAPLSCGIRRRPTLPGRVQPSTIGAEGLNFCVRNGNRWNPFAIATGNRFSFRARLSNACPTRYTLSSESPLRASRVYTTFHPEPLANLHNCTPSLSFSLHLDLSLNEAFDLLVAATSARYRASSAALSTC